MVRHVLLSRLKATLAHSAAHLSKLLSRPGEVRAFLKSLLERCPAWGRSAPAGHAPASLRPFFAIS